MFSDKRSKKIVIVAHCILNQNSLSAGTACYPGCAREIIDVMGAAGFGMLQMPCPEVVCLGLARGRQGGSTLSILEDNTRIRALMTQGPALVKIEKLAHGIVSQITEYRRHDFDVRGVVAVNRSPTCGVDTTTVCGREAEGEGVFIEALRKALADSGLQLPMAGIKFFEPRSAVSTVRGLIQRTSP